MTNPLLQLRNGASLLITVTLLVFCAVGCGSHGRRTRQTFQTQVTGVDSVPDPPGIVIHSSDTPAEVHGVPIDAERLNMIHRTDHPGWATRYHGKTYYIGYHYVILPDGIVQKGRPDHCPGCHARGYNNWLGICLIGAFSSRSDPNWWPHVPTVEEMASLMALCRRLMLKYHIPIANVRRHCDVNQTDCPGGRFPWQRFRANLSVWAAANEAGIGESAAAAPAAVRPGA